MVRSGRRTRRWHVYDFGNGRPLGERQPHRCSDGALPGVTSSSPLQTRYLPVGFTYDEGLARLVQAGVTIPWLRAGGAGRVALEAYPRLLAQEPIGRRLYKNKSDADRLFARRAIVDALEKGRTPLGLRLRLSHAQRDALVDDPAGNRLDAVFCLVQAA